MGECAILRRHPDFCDEDSLQPNSDSNPEPNCVPDAESDRHFDEYTIFYLFPNVESNSVAIKVAINDFKSDTDFQPNGFSKPISNRLSN